MRCIFCLLAFLTCSMCFSQKKSHVTKVRGKFLDSLLGANAQLKPFLQQKNNLNIQIIYTRIDRDKKNNPHFTDFTYQLSEKKYFYPASTVKMPIAFLALEKLNEMKVKGVNKY